MGKACCSIWTNPVYLARTANSNPDFVEPYNLSIAELASKEDLSIRAVHACQTAGLEDLNGLITYYQTHIHFQHLPNCGLKTSLEIEALCKKYLKLQSSTPGMSKDNPAKIYAAWSKKQKAEFEAFYDESVSQLRGRVKTRLRERKNVLGMQGFLNLMFSPGFHFVNLSHVGRGSIESLDQFKREISSFIYSRSGASEHAVNEAARHPQQKFER